MKRSDFPNLQTRRDFFRQAACAAVGTLSVATTIRDLRFINTAVAQGVLTDYKALVCIFLAGGNDSNNLIIPVPLDGNDTVGQGEYNNYAAVRQNLALSQTAVLPLVGSGTGGFSPLNSDGHTYALHPVMGKIRTLFGERKAAVVFNTGPLTYPLTRAQYSGGPKPPQLFSHSDQVTHWQTSIPDQPAKTGWGGRIADLIHPRQYPLINGIPAANAAKIALCTSLAGANTFEVGNTFAQYHVSTSGAVTISGLSAAHLARVKDILALGNPNLQRTAFAGVTKNALDTGDLLNAAIAGTSAAGYWTTQAFPTTSLGNQLRMIARLIQAGRRPSTDSPYPGLNMKRQIFFAQVGGYDTHTNQVGTTAAPTDTSVGAHANLLTEVSDAVFAFQRAMEQIGASNEVTAFTMSDFSRTFRTNGQGSDHAWGSHHMVFGGAVNGRKTYGTFPVLSVTGPDAVPTSNEGRWIPTIACDQYSATLARWFGVSEGDISTIFPNIGRFASPNIGFMV
jgi:uncharacterized protein (DUF1501 family)